MKYFRHLQAGAALAVLAAFALPAAAQDSGSMQAGNATISIGAGVARLWLPDVRFTLLMDNAFNTLAKDENSDIDSEYGYGLNGEIAFPVTGLSGNPKTVVVQGFYSKIEDDSTISCDGIAGVTRCGWAPIIQGPTKTGFGGGDDTIVRTDREVDHWGVSVEGRRLVTPSVMGVTTAPKPRYVAIGADIRGIDQELAIRGNEVQTPTNTLTYTEDLDATYYGVFVAYGGDYTLPFFGGLTSGWGLQSSFRLWGGVYGVDADYRGRYVDTTNAVTQTLSLSEEDVAFIGGLTLETRKRLSSRSYLSLRSDYTYYSWVPDMQYNDVGIGTDTGFNNRTSIGDDNAFSARTTLRLTIGLGPETLYQPPLK